MEGHCLKKKTVFLTHPAARKTLWFGGHATLPPCSCWSLQVSRALGKGWQEETAVPGLQSGARQGSQGTEVTHMPAPSEDSSILAADENRRLSQAEALAQSHTAGPQNGKPRPPGFWHRCLGDTLPPPETQGRSRASLLTQTGVLLLPG